MGCIRGWLTIVNALRNHFFRTHIGGDGYDYCGSESGSSIHRIDSRGSIIKEIYPLKYWPGEQPGDQLEFVLKYDGINIGILASLFEKMTEQDFPEYVRSKPTGKYARRLWFLYEFLTGKLLVLKDLKQGNYIDLFEPEKYYTITHFELVNSATSCLLLKRNKSAIECRRIYE